MLLCYFGTWPCSLDTETPTNQIRSIKPKNMNIMQSLHSKLANIIARKCQITEPYVRNRISVASCQKAIFDRLRLITFDMLCYWSSRSIAYQMYFYQATRYINKTSFHKKAGPLLFPFINGQTVEVVNHVRSLFLKPWRLVGQ